MGYEKREKKGDVSNPEGAVGPVEMEGAQADESAPAIKRLCGHSPETRACKPEMWVWQPAAPASQGPTFPRKPTSWRGRDERLGSDLGI